MKQRLRAYSAELSAGKYIDQPNHPPPSSLFSDAELDVHLSKCTERYIAAIGDVPRLLYQQLLLYQSVAGTEDAAVAIEHAYEDPEHTLLTVAIANSRNRPALQQTLSLLNMHGLEVLRAQVDSVLDPMPEGRPGLPSKGVTLLRTLVRKGEAEPDWGRLTSDLRRFKWVDDTTLALAAAQPKLGLLRAEAVRRRARHRRAPRCLARHRRRAHRRRRRRLSSAAATQAPPLPERPAAAATLATAATAAPRAATPPLPPPIGAGGWTGRRESDAARPPVAHAQPRALAAAQGELPAARGRARQPLPAALRPRGAAECRPFRGGL